MHQNKRIIVWGIAIIAILLISIYLFESLSRSNYPAKRIVFVTIDTLRADHVGIMGYPRNVTPFIDSLAKEGAVFKNAFSAAPHTAPSHTSMFTSLYPFRHNVLRNHDSLSSSIYSTHKYNDAIGYLSYAFTAVRFLEGKVGFPFIEGVSNGKDDNFEQFWYRNATNVVDNAISWIDTINHKDNFFVWLHFYDVHQWAGRKNIPKSYLEKVKEFPQTEHLEYIVKEHNIPIEFHGSEEKALRAINGYDARLMYVDDEMKRFSEHLSSRKMNDQIMWIVTSDHGEGLGNHNYKGHGQYLYQEQLHVPLIFHLPGVVTPQVNESLVRTVDIFPTYADIMNFPLDTVKLKMDGVSLMPLLKGQELPPGSLEFSFAERRPKDEVSFRREWEDGEIYSLHNLEGKYIEHSHGIDEFYDLVEDPFEMKNIEPESPPLMVEIRDVLSEIFDPSKRLAVGEEEDAHTPEEIEELKSLGYL